MKTCLIVVFNHKYLNNIKKIEQIYGNRFSQIYYLMPFYQKGDDEANNIISVYGATDRFYNFFPQGFDKFYDNKYDQYMVIADDMLLNPRINEDNLNEWFGLNNKCMCCKFKSLTEMDNWPYNRLVQNICSFEERSSVIKWKEELPSYEEAINIASHYGINSLIMKKGFLKNRIFCLPYLRLYRKYPKLTLQIMMSKFKLPYPFVYGYSDILIINKESIKKFCHYCSVFAAMDLHVEIAIPTAIMLAANELKLYGEFSLLDDMQSYGKYIKNIGKHDSIKKIFSNWDDKWDFIHPIKLSQHEL